MKVKITATSIEEFNQINAVLQSIPVSISEQIIAGEKGLIGFAFRIKRVTNKVILPGKVFYISHNGNDIVIGCEGYVLMLDYNPEDKIDYSFKN